MKIEYKIFRVVTFLVLSFPFLFFTYLLLKAEYSEWFLYGNIVNSQIVEIDYVDGDLEGVTTEIVVKSIYNNNTYVSVINLNTNFLDKRNLEVFSENVKIGDVIKIKVINESLEETEKSNTHIIKLSPQNTAKILSWKDISLYEGQFNWGEWIAILTLFFFGALCWYYIYKTLKTKTSYE